MELYALNKDFTAWQAVDIFTSLIWTERYNDAGDVEIVLPMTSPFLKYLPVGGFVGLDRTMTLEVMQILTKETTAADGTVKITGVSLVSILKERIFRDTVLTTRNYWSLTSTASGIIYTMMAKCVIPGAPINLILPDGVYDPITNLHQAHWLMDSPDITVPVPYGQMFDAVKMVADLDNIGFTLYPDVVNPNGTYTLLFKTYRGLDRTSTQSKNPPVILEPAADTLADVHSLESIDGYKNIAYAWPANIQNLGQVGCAYAPGTDGSTYKDFDRRVLMVDASDIDRADYSDTALRAHLDQKAKDALATNNYIRLTDGTIVPQSTFIYGIDYTLGDVVELRNDTGISQKARITEYIRSQDATGERGYPTLSVIG